MGLSKIKGLHIDGRKELTEHNGVVSYLNPKFVYFPTVAGNVVYKTLVSVGDNVLKGQPILERMDRFSHPVASSVSGKVTALKKMWHASGRMVEMLEIENDFKEETIESWGEPLENISKETIINRMKEAGIVGLGGAGFPTYVKYQVAFEMETLIVNAAECEPYITCDYQMIMTKADRLIQGIKYAMMASGAKNAYIAIKKSHPDAINKLHEAIGEIEDIHVYEMKDVYPAGWEKYIVEHITKKTYKSLPSEVKCVVNNVQTMIALANAVDYNIPLIEKTVTFSGEGFANPTNVYVKIGTLMSDVIDDIIKYKEDYSQNSYFVVGGPMTGRSIMFDNVVITSAVGSVLALEKGKEEANACMGCGKCAENCPAFLTPTEIKEAYTSNDNTALGKLNVTACIQCGLCSYVCPSRIEMTEYMFKAKDAYLKSVALKAKK